MNHQTLLNLAFSCDTESYFPRAGEPLSGLVYHFGDFWLDCGAFQLLRDGQSLRIERKPMELLILLASREGQLVTRNEIADRLWESEVFVDTEHGINTAVRKLRYPLRDDPDNPQFIQTVILTGDPQSAVNLRRAWDRGGAHGFVRWQLGRRLLQSKSRYVSPVELAGYYAQLGDEERTLALLEEGYQQHSTDTLWIQQDPVYDFLHSDPRFRSIVQRIDLAPAK